MATASRQVRKIRRLKRERTLAYKAFNLMAKQRDQARAIIDDLIKAKEVEQTISTTDNKVELTKLDE